jgi:ankyrin repeat protein
MPALIRDYFRNKKRNKLIKVIESGDLTSLSKRLKALDPATLDASDNGHLSAIEVAIRAGQAKAMELIISAGADIKKLASSHEPYLLLALQQKQSLALISVLLQSGANPEQIIEITDTHVVTACFRHCAPAELILHLGRFLQYGVNLNQPDSHGLTALDHALKTENKELLNFLITSGAQPPEVWPESLPDSLRSHLQRCVDDIRIRQMFLGQ